MLADSLPDKFGHALIDAWLVTQGRLPDALNAIERLCYTGARAKAVIAWHPEKNATCNRFVRWRNCVQKKFYREETVP